MARLLERQRTAGPSAAPDVLIAGLAQSIDAVLVTTDGDSVDHAVASRYESGPYLFV